MGVVRVDQTSILDDPDIGDSWTTTLHMHGIDEGFGHAVAHLLADMPEVEFASYHRNHPHTDDHVVKVTTCEEGLWRSAWSQALRSVRDLYYYLGNVLDGREESGNIVARVSLSKWRLDVQIRDVPVPVVNILRRFILGKVPVHAFSTFEVIRNRTNLSDEELITRIGQLPVRLPEGNEDLCQDADKKSNPPSVEASFIDSLPTLREQRALGGRIFSEKHVMSSSINCEPCTTHISVGSMEGIAEDDADFHIVSLVPGGGLHVKAKTQVGCADRHARFISAIQTAYSASSEPSEPSCVSMTFDMVGQLEAKQCLRLATWAVRDHCDLFDLDQGVDLGESQLA